MTKRQRNLLSELCSICNKLGNVLDSTATPHKKYEDRQRAHQLVYKVLLGVLSDDPENDFRDDDVQSAIDAMEKIKEISIRQYGDRSGL